MEALDASQAQAVDGVGGGTYTPSAKIIINGQGLQANNLTVTGLLSLTGNTTVGNSSSDLLTVVATPTFSAATTFTNTVTFNGATLEIFSDIFVHSGHLLQVNSGASFGTTASDAFTVNGTATFNAPLTCNASADFQDDATFHTSSFVLVGGSAQLGNDSSKRLSIHATLDTLVNLIGEGRVPQSWGGSTPASGHTFSAADGQIFWVNPFNTGPIVYQLSATGAVPGDIMIFFTGRVWPADTVTIKSNGSGQDAVFIHNQPNQLAIFTFNGSSWLQAFVAN